MTEPLNMSDMIPIVSAIISTDIARYLNIDELNMLSNVLYCLSGDLASIAAARTFVEAKKKGQGQNELTKR